MEDLIKLAKENPNDRDFGRVARSSISGQADLEKMVRENPNDDDLGRNLRTMINNL